MSTENQSPSLSSLLGGVQPVTADADLQQAIIDKAAAESVDPNIEASNATAAAQAELDKNAEPGTLTPEEQEAKDIADAEALAAEEPPETEELDAETFYATLDALYGEDINSGIDYGETNPMAPEGVFIREQHIRERSMEEFANSLKENDPRAYSYFLHRSSGGSDDDFFSQKSFVLPDLQEIQGDVDLQREVYNQLLLNRGNSQKQADALIKMAIDAGELQVESEEAYKIFQQNEAKTVAQAEVANKANQARIAQDSKEIGDAINEVINSNNALKIIIPKNEKELFSEQFRKNVHYENGNFFLVKPLSKENLPQLMESELFAYLGGDVSKLVQKQATTIAATRTLKRITPKVAVQTNITPSVGKALKEIL